MRNFDLEAQDNSGRLYNYSIDVRFRELMLADFKPYIDSHSEAHSLEIGSFDGSMTSQILNYVNSLTVVEPSQELCSQLRNRFGTKVKVINSTIEDYQALGKYSNIFLIHTLEHVESPVEVLQKVKSLLKEDGKLFIAVPNANALSRQIAVHMNVISHNSAVLDSEAKQGHLRTYAIDTLRRDIITSGFSIHLLSGVFLKAFANFQLDSALKYGIIDDSYINAANSLAKIYPDFAASLIAVCALKTEH